ncbi:MAG: alpha/beta fold hydrolase [Acidobacteria bacterium]|nr:alpha/beta fold hydrolase [Acidobacteriota bacterium]
MSKLTAPRSIFRSSASVQSQQCCSFTGSPHRFTFGRPSPKLADAGFHVVALDLIGFGYSEKPAWFDYSIQSQARMISRFMDRLGIGTATLVGSSYGGAVVLTVALDYPERVEKLVLVDAVINDEPKIIRSSNLLPFPASAR